MDAGLIRQLKALRAGDEAAAQHDAAQHQQGLWDPLQLRQVHPLIPSGAIDLAEGLRAVRLKHQKRNQQQQKATANACGFCGAFPPCGVSVDAVLAVLCMWAILLDACGARGQSVWVE